MARRFRAGCALVGAMFERGRSKPVRLPDCAFRDRTPKAMSFTKQNQSAREDLFTLTVDQYGRLWLHAKLEGVPVSIDLAERDAAFDIMADTMAENGFEYRPIQAHEQADNDDQPQR